MSRALVRALKELPTAERRIKTAAAARGLTLSGICHDAGVSVSQVSRHLKGYDPLRDEHKENIASILDVPVDVLWVA